MRVRPRARVAAGIPLPWSAEATVPPRRPWIPCSFAVSLGLAAAACHEAASREAVIPSAGTSTDAGGEASDASTGTTFVDEPASTGTDADGSGEGSTDAGDTGEPEAPPWAYYPASRVHSPITASVAAALRARVDASEGAQDVFMKVGASSDVNPNNLHCFAGDGLVWGAHVELQDAWSFFLGGDAAGSSPFDRDSVATEVGRTAAWAITGEPSPLQLEIDALAPSLAFVHYGTNDMNLGITPLTALPGFYGALMDLLDHAEAAGVIPVLVGLTRRGDDPDADRFIALYNTVLRGVAQARQIPFVDAHLAIDGLPGHGLGADGLHLEPDPRGACTLDDAGLMHGYNRRNLAQLELLARMFEVVQEQVDGLDAPTDEIAPPLGDGLAASPIVIEPARLPFADARDTLRDGAAVIDGYPGCGSADESGPELVYALSPEVDTPVRIVVLDRVGTDVDVQLLGDDLDPTTCLARDDTAISTTLSGPVRIVVDSWSDGTSVFGGAYLLVVVPCDDGDLDCAG